MALCYGIQPNFMTSLRGYGYSGLAVTPQLNSPGKEILASSKGWDDDDETETSKTFRLKAWNLPLLSN